MTLGHEAVNIEDFDNFLDNINPSKSKNDKMFYAVNILHTDDRT